MSDPSRSRSRLVPFSQSPPKHPPHVIRPPTPPPRLHPDPPRFLRLHPELDQGTGCSGLRQDHLRSGPGGDCGVVWVWGGQVGQGEAEGGEGEALDWVGEG